MGSLGSSRAVRGGALLLLLILTTACGGASSATSPSLNDISAPPRQVLVLGDSLAVSPTLEQSFPAQLQIHIDRAGLRWTIVNAGVSGDTSARGLRRLEPLLTSDVGILV